MLQLSLDEAEARELKTALDRFARDLLNEIAHSDDRHYRADITHTYDCLEEVRRRLGGLLAQEAQPTTPMH